MINADYVGPSLTLVLLNYWRVCFDIDITAWLNILVLGISHGLITESILIKVDNRIQMLCKEVNSQDCVNDCRFEFSFQPWVNRLPTTFHLKGSIVACLESQWRTVKQAVQIEKQHKVGLISPLDSTDIGIGVLLTAIYLFISEHSSQLLTPLKCQQCFNMLNRYMGKMLYSDSDSIFPANIYVLVKAFSNAASKSKSTYVSTHTCCEFRWDNIDQNNRQCYAAAYVLLHPNCTVVPLLEPLAHPAFYNHYYPCNEKCFQKCIKCQELPNVEPLAAPANKDTHLPAVRNY